MKTLLTIGDSHTFGAEILGEGNYSEKNKNHAWPKHLGDILSHNVINLGQSGASLKRTERLLVDYLALNVKPDIVVIGWTCLGRWEICTGTDENGEYDYVQYNSWFDIGHAESEDNISRYNALLPIITADDLLAEKYRIVIRCQNLLENLKIPYIMFDVMESTKNQAPISGSGDDKVDKLWSGNNPLDIALENMINRKTYIDTIYWEYLQYRMGVKINGGHYNETAHKIWAEYLSKYFI